jgi:hypothetical protein
VAGDGWDEQVGSVAEEAQRLLESLRRAGDAVPEPDTDEAPAGSREGPGGAAEGGAGEGAAAAGGSWTCTDPFCRACPLCRTVAVVRGLSPETLARLSDLATVAAAVLSDLAGERARGAEEPARDPGPGRHRSAPPAASPIPVRDADDEEAARG